jgi:hypothetical protein
MISPRLERERRRRKYRFGVVASGYSTLASKKRTSGVLPGACEKWDAIACRLNPAMSRQFTIGGSNLRGVCRRFTDAVLRKPNGEFR